MEWTNLEESILERTRARLIDWVVRDYDHSSITFVAFEDTTMEMSIKVLGDYIGLTSYGIVSDIVDRRDHAIINKWSMVLEQLNKPPSRIESGEPIATAIAETVNQLRHLKIGQTIVDKTATGDLKWEVKSSIGMLTFTATTKSRHQIHCWYATGVNYGDALEIISDIHCREDAWNRHPEIEVYVRINGMDGTLCTIKDAPSFLYLVAMQVLAGDIETTTGVII